MHTSANSGCNIQVQAVHYCFVAKTHTHTHTYWQSSQQPCIYTCSHNIPGELYNGNRLIVTHVTRAAQRSSLEDSKHRGRENIKCKFLSSYIKMQQAQTKYISIMTVAWCAYGALVSPWQALHGKWAASPTASFMNSRGFVCPPALAALTLNAAAPSQTGGQLHSTFMMSVQSNLKTAGRCLRARCSGIVLSRPPWKKCKKNAKKTWKIGNTVIH